MKLTLVPELERWGKSGTCGHCKAAGRPSQSLRSPQLPRMSGRETKPPDDPSLQLERVMRLAHGMRTKGLNPGGIKSCCFNYTTSETGPTAGPSILILGGLFLRGAGTNMPAMVPPTSRLLAMCHLHPAGSACSMLLTRKWAQAGE